MAPVGTSTSTQPYFRMECERRTIRFPPHARRRTAYHTTFVPRKRGTTHSRKRESSHDRYASALQPSPAFAPLVDGHLHHCDAVHWCENGLHDDAELPAAD